MVGEIGFEPMNLSGQIYSLLTLTTCILTHCFKSVRQDSNLLNIGLQSIPLTAKVLTHIGCSKCWNRTNLHIGYEPSGDTNLP